MSDLIRRQDAIDAVNRVNESHMNLKGMPMFGCGTLLIEIELLPSIVPEYKKFCGVPIEEAARIVQEHNADKPTGDLISRQDAINAMWKALYAYEDLTEKQFMEHEELELEDWFQHRIFVQRMHEECMKAVESLPSAEPKTGWIPIKWHEITEEEREREGYPKDWVVHIDCDMPCDGDEILVQTKKGYIRWDVCYEDGEFSLDSGWDWIEDIVAWMPLPESYREGGE